MSKKPSIKSNTSFSSQTNKPLTLSSSVKKLIPKQNRFLILRIGKLDEKSTTVNSSQNNKLNLLNENVLKLEEELKNEHLSKEFLQEKLRKEIRQTENNILLNVNLEKQDFSLLDTKTDDLIREKFEEVNKEYGAQKKTSEKIFENLKNDYQTGITLMREKVTKQIASRKNQYQEIQEKISNNIQKYVKNIEDDAKTGEELRKKYKFAIENMRINMINLILTEAKERKEVEDLIANFLEDTCNRIEKKYYDAYFYE